MGTPHKGMGTRHKSSCTHHQSVYAPNPEPVTRFRPIAMPDTLLVLTNLPDSASAERIARRLVEQRLAACVNILAPCTSVYRWNAAIETATEVPLLIKTTRARYAELEAALAEAHPYELPEIVAVPLHTGLPAYLAWVGAETATPQT